MWLLIVGVMSLLLANKENLVISFVVQRRRTLGTVYLVRRHESQGIHNETTFHSSLALAEILWDKSINVNQYTSSMKRNKINPSVILKTLAFNNLEPAYYNSISQQTRKRIYKTLDISVIQSPIAPPSRDHQAININGNFPKKTELDL